MFKEHTLTKSRNVFSRNHHTCFCLRIEGRQIPNTKQLLYQTDKNQPLEVFCKEIYSFNIHRRTPVLESLFNNVGVLRPAILLKRDYNTGDFL